MGEKYVFLDSETSGNSDDSQIIRITALKVDKNFNVLEKFERYVKPVKKLTKEVEKLTGITNKMLENCSAEREVLQDFLTFLYGNILIAYNAKFEMKFILKGIYNNNLEDFRIKYFNIFELVKLKITNIRPRTIQSVAKYLNIKENDMVMKLIEIVRYLMVDSKKQALTDFLELYKDNNNIYNCYTGLTSRNITTIVEFESDNYKEIEFIDDSKDRMVGYIINRKCIEGKKITFYELMQLRTMGAVVCGEVGIINNISHNYIDYGKIDSSMDLSLVENRLILKELESALSNVKRYNKKIICYGLAEELKRNYQCLKKESLDILLSNVIFEIKK